MVAPLVVFSPQTFLIFSISHKVGQPADDPEKKCYMAFTRAPWKKVRPPNAFSCMAKTTLIWQTMGICDFSFQINIGHVEATGLGNLRKSGMEEKERLLAMWPPSENFWRKCGVFSDHSTQFCIKSSGRIVE